MGIRRFGGSYRNTSPFQEERLGRTLDVDTLEEVEDEDVFQIEPEALDAPLDDTQENNSD